MSIQGINPALAGAGIVPGLDRPRVGEQPAPQETSRPAANPDATPRPSQEALSDLVPSDPPAGTDPALWKVLSSEERAFFARARAMGPLTYGPGRATESKIPTALQGGRIDVRV